MSSPARITRPDLIQTFTQLYHICGVLSPGKRGRCAGGGWAALLPTSSYFKHGEI